MERSVAAAGALEQGARACEASRTQGRAPSSSNLIWTAPEAPALAFDCLTQNVPGTQLIVMPRCDRPRECVGRAWPRSGQPERISHTTALLRDSGKVGYYTTILGDGSATSGHMFFHCGVRFRAFSALESGNDFPCSTPAWGEAAFGDFARGNRRAILSWPRQAAHALGYRRHSEVVRSGSGKQHSTQSR